MQKTKIRSYFQGNTVPWEFPGFSYPNFHPYSFFHCYYYKRLFPNICLFLLSKYCIVILNLAFRILKNTEGRSSLWYLYSNGHKLHIVTMVACKEYKYNVSVPTTPMIKSSLLPFGLLAFGDKQHTWLGQVHFWSFHPPWKGLIPLSLAFFSILWRKNQNPLCCDCSWHYSGSFHGAG